VYQRNTHRTGFCVENEEKDGTVLVFFWNQQTEVKKTERVLTSTLNKQLAAKWWEDSLRA
jgi:hypothetical protein